MVIKLSKTSKMPCSTWSTQAIETCSRGKTLSKEAGSVCSLCYACNGSYNFPCTINRRTENLKDYLSNPIEWVELISDKINKQRTRLFRWFDSGDLLNIEQLIDIITVADNCPDTKFWLPSRETGILKEYLVNRIQKIPSNLNIRISADFINKDCFDTYYWHGLGCTFSTVEENMDRISLLKLTPCHATMDKSGKCGTCTKCWSKSVSTISYKLH